MTEHILNAIILWMIRYFTGTQPPAFEGYATCMSTFGNSSGYAGNYSPFTHQAPTINSHRCERTLILAGWDVRSTLHKVRDFG
jgi:hypothetical protein